jgi:hypothetical protein
VGGNRRFIGAFYPDLRFCHCRKGCPMRLAHKLAKPVTAAVMAALALSACTASRYQVANALTRYGLSDSQASCASEFLRGRLSTGQVDRLSRAAVNYRSNSSLTFGDLLRVAVSLRDTQTMLEVGAAAAACGVAADIPLPRLR